MTLYDHSGRPTAYMADEEHIYLFSGKPVAYLSSDAIYTYSGLHIGWLDDGWIRDLDGNCVFFTEGDSGFGPVKPVKNVMPVKGVKGVLPVKSVKEVRHIKSVKSLSWSNLSGESFFR